MSEREIAQAVIDGWHGRQTCKLSLRLCVRILFQCAYSFVGKSRLPILPDGRSPLEYGDSYIRFLKSHVEIRYGVALIEIVVGQLARVLNLSSSRNGIIKSFAPFRNVCIGKMKI